MNINRFRKSSKKLKTLVFSLAVALMLLFGGTGTQPTNAAQAAQSHLVIVADDGGGVTPPPSSH